MKKEFADFAVVVATVFVALVLFYSVWQPIVWPKIQSLFKKA